jgi:hypothetical protein
MQEQHLYEYAVIRVLPKVEREEFLNIGIIMFCKKAKYIKMKYHIDANKLQLFASELDFETLDIYLQAFEKITNASKDGGPIAQFDMPSRFRWLTAVRSSVLQTSRPHPGLSLDLEGTLERLFQELVL